MNNAVLEIIESFNLEDYRPILPRDIDLGKPLAPKAGNPATIITGMRRCGKTYRMFQTMDELAQQGIPESRMLYFNFEDNRLTPITTKTGDEVIEAFFYLHPDAESEGAYLFFDELQEMDGWGKWMRRIIDTTKATVYVTGSSSRMLSADLTTEFRGRSTEHVMYPFSFREYIMFHEPELDLNKRAFSTGERLKLESLLDRYLLLGGFPGVQTLPDERAVLMLQDYAQRVVSRDVIERHNVSNPRVAVGLSRKALALNGRAISIRKLENEFKSSGLNTSRAMLSDIMGYLEDSFMLYQVRERSRALATSYNGTTKVYAADPGLARVNSPAATNDAGQALENAVFIELLRREPFMREDAISFMRTQEHSYEVDFAVGDALFDEGLKLYQVTDSLTDEATMKRETRALYEAMRERNLQTSTLIVKNGKRQTLEQDGLKIEAIPAWEWLLGNDNED